MIKYKAQSVGRFYFLDYFYVLLKSIDEYSKKDEIFNSFKVLKQKYQLGESKYKKLTSEPISLSQTQMIRYKYTFEQVIDESLQYKLISIVGKDEYYLTNEGEKILNKYRINGSYAFNKELFVMMEKKHKAFNSIINFCYETNSRGGGLLIFPIYSPRRLGIDPSNMKINQDLYRYCELLKDKLEEDIKQYLNRSIQLNSQNRNLKQRLIKAGMLTKDLKAKFESNKYNAILKRIRDFWLNTFLKEVYKYPYSFRSFEIWAYRGKQVGIIHVTEFFPNFNGRLVYPTSVILNEVNSRDFENLFQYDDGNSLFIHRPSWNSSTTQEEFIDSLTSNYFNIRKTNRSYYINLADLRELVCYNLKLSEKLFDDFLDQAYRLSISEKLRINISLEADKLPQETSAMYLKRVPVKIQGVDKNIIAIDIARGDKQHGKTKKKFKTIN
jgi:hypothetical protein